MYNKEWLQDKTKILLLLCLGLVGLDCKGRDYYSDLTNPSAVDYCDPNKKELDDACRRAIEKNVNLDLASYVGHEDVEEAMLQAIHALLVSPIAFPKDKKFLGLLPVDSLQAWEFNDVFLSDPKANLNLKFTNYVLNGFSVLAYTDASTPGRKYAEGYDPTNRSVRLNVSRGSAWIDASLLLHEVRHGEAFDHPIDCPNKAQLNVPLDERRECDMGMDLSDGWELMLDWGFLQGSGNADNASRPNALTEVEAFNGIVSLREFCIITHSIFDFPLDALALIHFDCDSYLANFRAVEKLQFS